MSNLYETLTDNEDPIAVAKRLASSVNSTFYDIGCLLLNIRDGDLYKTVDNNKYYSNEHKNWRKFVEDTFDISYRSAQYWLNIYRYFDSMGVDKERLIAIGWSKAKEFIDVTEDVNVLERGLQVAETGTIQDVQYWKSTVKTNVERLGEDERETLTSKTFTFKYYEATAESVDEILTYAAKETNGNTDEALFKIMIEWYQSQKIVEESQDIVVYEVTEDEDEFLQTA